MTRCTRLIAFGVLALTVVSCSSGGGGKTSGAPAAPPKTGAHPNIVFVLTDDLDLVEYADPKAFPAFHDLLTTQGTTFSNYFVTDSLCCPSRASILRGQYVHNHQVEGNLPPAGGFEHWQQLGRDSSTVATWLHSAGYRTALLGKYLNGYPATVARTYVPPGWDDWASPSGGNPYAEYNYQLNENGKLKNYGAQPSDYLVDVLAQKSRDFIDANAGKQPFFMYVAPYVPHQPATPAPRHADAFPGVKAPRTPSYDQADMSAEPAWLQRRPHLSPAVQTYIDQLYRRRLQSMLGVDDMLRTIVDALTRTGQLDNTYIVFTSDNGFHLGQHRLPPGKQTPYEEDIHVPLVVRGPGVAAGRTASSFTREIDLAPTFADLAGATAPSFVDGSSFASVLHGGTSTAPPDVLIEHYATAGTRAGRRATADEPDDDANPPDAGTPPSVAKLRVPRRQVAVVIPTYRALRTDRYLYVEYDTGEKQLYDVRNDRNELHNLAATAGSAVVTPLADRLAQLAKCAGSTCRA
jgi:N-acetylglucosamine-6-sulfatase